MDIKSHQFKALSKKALTDTHLQKALMWIDERLAAPRNAAFAHLEHADALRERAHRIRKDTLDRLDGYLEDLERKIIRLGGKVHWASTDAQAREIIENLAMDRGVRRVVKGKSMVSEEVALNQSLTARGIEVWETDLGEFIIQLADEPPSHLVGPAIHKTKEQISRLFSEELGTDQMNDPQEMTWFARRFLRRKFFRADMGITGANFAVSQSGTIVLFENEGNIRLTTTLPKIHVALMGIEKVVPGLDELSVLMKLLARSCTGQKLPSYVSMISGPRRSGERDGPEEFHLVILDNGRSRILADPELRPSLYCIRCGACLNFCPVYLKIGGHAYGWVYSGPIGSILTPQLIRKKQAYALPHASTLCGACAEVCPVNIPLPEILLALRRRYAEDPDWKGAPPAVETGLLTLLGVAMRRRGPYVWILKMAWLAQKIFLKNGRSRFFSRLFNRIGPPQPVPLLAPKSFRQIWGAHGQAHKESEHEP